MALCLPIIFANGVTRAVAQDAQGFSRHGSTLIVPESSALRSRISVMTVTADETRRMLTFPAVVESEPSRTANVLPALSGRLVALKTGLGERVQRGQALALIDSPDLDQAFDDNDKADDAWELTQKTLSRQIQQFHIHAISAQALDQARSDNAQARAEYLRTSARLRLLGVSANGTRLLTVRAPIGGSVTALSAATGVMINDPTQSLMTIADLGEVWVTAMVPETDIGDVSNGEDATVRFTAYPGKVQTGTVLFASDVLEPDTHRDKIRIAFANPGNRLKPNMFASVTLLGPPSRRIVLPASAILMNNDRMTVFVETSPWVFERRVVTADLLDNGTAQIQSGLSDKERVVVSGGILLND